MNLFTAAPHEIHAWLENETDPELISILIRLEDAAGSGEEDERINAIDALSELLVLKRGGL